MQCTHPVNRTYKDVMGHVHTYTCPCGKCIACQHNFQDSWYVRMLEECKCHDGFLYTTLTFRDESLPLVDYTDVIMEHHETPLEEPHEGTYSFENVLRIPEDWMKHIDQYLTIDEETGEYRYTLPDVPKSLVQNWIKRGRENYAIDHDGKRLNMKYFLVMEHGPKTSRPHFHAIFWGVTLDVFRTYFEQPWQEDFGYTVTYWIGPGGTQKTGKSVDGICRYVSKYVSKGVFDSPLVQLGLVYKPFRCVSKGIGEGYLDNPKFNYYKQDFVKFMKSICVDKYDPLDELRNQKEGSNIVYKQRVQSAVEHDLMDGWYRKPTEMDIQAITTYVHNGFTHSLPRYYKQKLLNLFKPNLFSYEIQTILLENSRVHRNQELQEFAARLGYRVDFGEKTDTYAGFGRKLYDILLNKFTVAKVSEAKAEAKRRYVTLKNQYGRAYNHPTLC